VWVGPHWEAGNLHGKRWTQNVNGGVSTPWALALALHLFNNYTASVSSFRDKISEF